MERFSIAQSVLFLAQNFSQVLAGISKIPPGSFSSSTQSFPLGSCMSPLGQQSVTPSLE